MKSGGCPRTICFLQHQSQFVQLCAASPVTVHLPDVLLLQPHLTVTLCLLITYQLDQGQIKGQDLLEISLGQNSFSEATGFEGFIRLNGHQRAA